MSADHSSFPSAMEARNKWEQMAQSSDAGSGSTGIAGNTLSAAPPRPGSKRRVPSGLALKFETLSSNDSETSGSSSPVAATTARAPQHRHSSSVNGSQLISSLPNSSAASATPITVEMDPPAHNGSGPGAGSSRSTSGSSSTHKINKPPPPIPSAKPKPAVSKKPAHLTIHKPGPAAPSLPTAVPPPTQSQSPKKPAPLPKSRASPAPPPLLNDNNNDDDDDDDDSRTTEETTIVSVTINPTTNRPVSTRTPPPLPLHSYPGQLGPKFETLSLQQQQQPQIPLPRPSSGSPRKQPTPDPAVSQVPPPPLQLSSNPGSRSSSVPPPPIMRKSTPTGSHPLPASAGSNPPPAAPVSGSATLNVPRPPPSRPVTPVTPAFPPPGANSMSPYLHQPTSSSPQHHQSVTDLHNEPKAPLPDPALFPPPPRHYTLTQASPTTDSSHAGPAQLYIHKRTNSSIPPTDLSKLAPPPYVSHLPNDSKDVSHFAPPPPPTRKLRSSSSQSNLEASLDRDRTPSPAVPSPAEFNGQGYFAPAPTSAGKTMSLPITMPIAAPVPLKPPPAIGPGLAAAPSPPHHLPDPSAFPPPPQRGDYFSSLNPSRRISDSAISPGLPHHQSSPSASLAASALSNTPSNFTLVPPPRRGTSIASSDSTLYNASTDDSAYDSDDTTPGAPVSTNTPGGAQDTVVYVDWSQANRRAPIFGGHVHELSSKGKVDALGFCGNIACISSSSTTFAVEILTGERIWSISHSETRITAIEFKPSPDVNLRGRIVWLGTKEGHLWEADIYDGGNSIAHKRTNVHMSPIVSIQAVGDTLWTISDDGKICIWDSYINDTPKVFRMTPFFKALCVAHGGSVSGDQIWVGRNRQINAYHPSLSPNEVFNVTSRPIQCPPLPPGKTTGAEFTCATCVQRYPDSVFFGHEDGSITVVSRARGTVVETVSITVNKITSLAGVGGNLWIGTSTGVIYVAEIGSKPWRIVKEWKAHESSVRAIVSNEDSFFSSPEMSHMPVVSIGSEQGVFIWDGLLKTDWIENDMQDHDDQFCQYDEMRLLYMTWNAGAAKTADLDRTTHDRMFLNNAFNRSCDSSDGPEIMVFGFQELVNLDNKSVTAKTMFSKRNKREKDQKVATSTHISPQYKDWQDRLGFEIIEYFGENYNLVHSSNMVGLFTCVFVKAKHVHRLRSIKSGKTKTGLGGLHGNKGGIAVRLMVDDSSICFVNCHLAAGQNHVLNRNRDIETILQTPMLDATDNTKYVGRGIFVNGGDGTMILDHEFCFFAGDMNYRINLHRPTAVAMIQDADLGRLRDADQLLTQLRRNPGHRLRAFHEHPITFPPTYKFDVGTDNYDTSEKRRVPAWCDRIYFRSRNDNRVDPESYMSLSVRVSDHKPVLGMYKLKVKTIDPARRKEVYKSSLERWQVHLNGFVEELAQYYKY